MALRRLVAAVAFTVLLGGPTPMPARASEPHRSAPIPAAALAELDAGLEAMRTLSIHRARVDWTAMRARAVARLASRANATEADADAVLRNDLAELGDHHSSLLSPAEVAAAEHGELATFGITVLAPEGTVAAVAPGGPAERAGIRSGDRVTAIDGRGLIDHRGLAAIPADRTVELRLRGKNVNLAAATIDVALAPSARSLAGGIGYLELPTSASGDPVAFVGQAQRAIAAADGSGACGWVLDLRRNRGGDPFRLLAAAGPLLGDGPVGAFRFQTGDVAPLDYADGDARMDGDPRAGVLGLPYRLGRNGAPVAILTSRLTASAGEQVAVAFAGRPATRRFGEPTRGIPTLNRGSELPSGARLWVTTAVMVDRTGQAWDRALAPDQVVATNWADFAGSTDPALAAAEAWLGHQPGCA